MEIPKAEAMLQQVFSISGPADFLRLSLGVFQFQYYNNPVYQAYCKLLKTEFGSIQQLEQIPFLPISFFKTHSVRSTVYQPEIIFESSGTTGSVNSMHAIRDLSVYRNSFFTAFQNAYGPPEHYCILGLLPSYLERGSSSLVFMVEALIKKTGHPLSGFYLYDFQKLADTLIKLENEGRKTLLIGVTYALLDFAEQFSMPLKNTIVMETGGMKGRRKELLRQEVHAQLQAAFQMANVHSEYGMTELLSQAYAPEEGRFHPPPWMKVMVREEDDPFSFLPFGRSGGINVIDLANIYSCSFIATEDTGRLYEDGSFIISGRMDQAAVRGCSQLYL